MIYDAQLLDEESNADNTSHDGMDIDVPVGKRWYQSRRAKVVLGLMAVLCISAAVVLSVLGAQGTLPSATNDDSGAGDQATPIRPSFKSLASVLPLPAPVVSNGSRPGYVRSQLNFTHVNQLNESTHFSYDVEHHESIVSPEHDEQILQISCNATHITVFLSSAAAVANKSATWMPGTLITIQASWACGQTIRRLTGGPVQPAVTAGTLKKSSSASTSASTKVASLQLIYPTVNATMQDLFKSAFIYFKSNFTDPAARAKNASSASSGSSTVGSSSSSSSSSSSNASNKNNRRRRGVMTFFEDVVSDAITVADDVVDAAEAIVTGTFDYNSTIQHTWSSPEYVGTLDSLTYATEFNAGLTTYLLIQVNNFNLEGLEASISMQGMAAFAAVFDKDLDQADDWKSDMKSIVNQTNLCTFLLPIGAVELPISVFVSLQGGIGFGYNGTVAGNITASASVSAEGGLRLDPTTGNLVSFESHSFEYQANDYLDAEVTVEASVAIIPQVFFKVAYIGGPQVMVPMALLGVLGIEASESASLSGVESSDGVNSVEGSLQDSVSTCLNIGASVELDIGAAIDVVIGTHTLLDKSTNPLPLWQHTWWFYQHPTNCTLPGVSSTTTGSVDNGLSSTIADTTTTTTAAAADIDITSPAPIVDDATTSASS